MVAKEKAAKKEDVVEIIGKAELETITKRVRAKFPKGYEVTGIFKIGSVRIDNAEGVWVAEISMNDSEARKIFGK